MSQQIDLSQIEKIVVNGQSIRELILENELLWTRAADASPSFVAQNYVYKDGPKFNSLAPVDPDSVLSNKPFASPQPQGNDYVRMSRDGKVVLVNFDYDKLIVLERPNTDAAWVVRGSSPYLDIGPSGNYSYNGYNTIFGEPIGYLRDQDRDRYEKTVFDINHDASIIAVFRRDPTVDGYNSARVDIYNWNSTQYSQTQSIPLTVLPNILSNADGDEFLFSDPISAPPRAPEVYLSFCHTRNMFAITGINSVKAFQEFSGDFFQIGLDIPVGDRFIHGVSLADGTGASSSPAEAVLAVTSISTETELPPGSGLSSGQMGFNGDYKSGQVDVFRLSPDNGFSWVRKGSPYNSGIVGVNSYGIHTDFVGSTYYVPPPVVDTLLGNYNGIDNRFIWREYARPTPSSPNTKLAIRYPMPVKVPTLSKDGSRLLAADSSHRHAAIYILELGTDLAWKVISQVDNTINSGESSATSRYVKPRGTTLAIAANDDLSFFTCLNYSNNGPWRFRMLDSLGNPTSSGSYYKNAETWDDRVEAMPYTFAVVSYSQKSASEWKRNQPVKEENDDAFVIGQAQRRWTNGNVLPGAAIRSWCHENSVRHAQTLTSPTLYKEALAYRNPWWLYNGGGLCCDSTGDNVTFMSRYAGSGENARGVLTDSILRSYKNEPWYGLVADRSSVFEGGSVTITLKTRGVANDTDVAYTITGIQNADILEPTTGTFTVSNSRAYVTINSVADSSLEGNQSMTLSLDNGEANVIITIIDSST